VIYQKTPGGWGLELPKGKNYIKIEDDLNAQTTKEQLPEKEMARESQKKGKK